MRLRRYQPGDDPVAIYGAFLSGEIRMVFLGMWQDESAARAVLEHIWARESVADPPRTCNLPWFVRHRLTGLLCQYRNSPYLLLSSLYPGRWEPIEFGKLPWANDLQATALTVQRIDPGLPPNQRRRQTLLARAAKHQICIRCSAPLRGRSSRLCPDCQRSITNRLHTDRRRRVAEGLCSVPGCASPPEPNRRMCAAHRDRDRERMKRYRASRLP